MEGGAREGKCISVTGGHGHMEMMRPCGGGAPGLLSRETIWLSLCWVSSQGSYDPSIPEDSLSSTPEPTATAQQPSSLLAHPPVLLNEGHEILLETMFTYFLLCTLSG